MSEKLLTLAFATARGAGEAAAYAARLIKLSGFTPRQVSVLAYAENRRGLCAVYNEALRRADGRYLALLHDDLSFEKAPGWGRKLARVFERHPQYSVLGVAGCSMLQESGNWFHPTVNCGHIYQRQGERTELHRFSLPHDRPLPAAALDGVFLIARTEDVRELELDEQRFDRFHFYDAEFCAQARRRGLRLGVTDAIDLIHFSMGDYGAEWEHYRRRFVDKYAAALPSSALETGDLFPFRSFSRKVSRAPAVAVLIPTRDRVDLVRNAVNAIRARTAPGLRYRIYVLDTGSSPAALEQLRGLPGVRLIELGYYNFAAIHNDVILRRDLIEEELLLFHNNDVEFVNDVLAHLLHAWKTTAHAGTLGARLHFPNGLLQHAGVRVLARLEPPSAAAGHYGYQTLWNFSHAVQRGTTGNTFALALMERELYRSLGGLNEDYAGCFEDVELNLRAILAGRSNVFVGDAVALHHESLTRNEDLRKSATQARDQERLSAFVRSRLEPLTPWLEVDPSAPAVTTDDAGAQPRQAAFVAQ